MRTVSLLALLLLAVLAGCAAEGDAAPPRADARLVEYSRTGGFAGVDEHVTVTRGGLATVTIGRPRHRERTRFRLTTAQRRVLEDALRRADIPTLRGPRGPMAGADFFEYRITQGRRSVYFWTTEIPPRATRLVGVLDGIVREAGRRRAR